MNIKIKGAREHNLKNIDVEIPRNKLVVITGLSGSGKSSLTYDTIFAEAQRDYLESLSTYARRTMPKINPANVDSIEGLSPCIIIDQKPLAKNPRSTVGTVTDVYSFLRLLYSRMGNPILNSEDFSFNTPKGASQRCTGLGVELVPNLERLIDFNKSLNEGALLHRTWGVGTRYWNIINALGKFDMNKKIKDYSKEKLDLLLYSKPIKRANSEPGYVQRFSFQGIICRLKKRQADSRGLESNSYDQDFFSFETCHDCNGSRLNQRARSVIMNGHTIVDLLTMELYDLYGYIKKLKGDIAERIKPFMEKILKHMIDVGIGYLTLSRSVSTLSNGESQKVKLSRHLSSVLTELIYILDEPTAGLHAKDINHLCNILKELVIRPNTVIVVEHDKTMMLNADYIIDLGPGAGKYGGELVATGSVAEIKKSETTIGKYLSQNHKKHEVCNRRSAKEYVSLKKVNYHNLKNINVDIPLHIMTCITGVAGSGKSSLIEVLINRYPKIISVDQSPVGATPRSNPATYVGAFNLIRKEFALGTGKNPSIFSFNSKGACPECGGLGYIKMDMHFLGDVSQVCEYCEGKRYNQDVLKLYFKGKNISDLLSMTIIEVFDFFTNKQINEKLNLLIKMGLGYLRLGQSLNTLSGGEAQRIKLGSKLSKKSNIYVLDEPTRGLNHVDIERLLQVLNSIVSTGNTVIIIEHNIDVIKSADWIIDLGPEGGKNGGEIVFQGTPEELTQYTGSHTGLYLSKELK